MRAGPGAPADAATLARAANAFDFEADGIDDDDVGPDVDGTEPWLAEDFGADWFDGEPLAHAGFHTVELLWKALGGIDRDARLTPLGLWGLPEALLRAWQPTE